jgi:oligopeptide transport system substrate-binding protein
VKKIIGLSFVLILVLSLVLSGCDLIYNPFSKTPSTTPSVSSPAGGNGELNLLDSDPTTLDPAVSTETTSSQYIMLIYSGLLKFNDKLEPVGDIATTWDISQDGLTYTFHLRKDAKFQSGRAISAADFKYSWERAANPATGSQTAGTYLGDIVGVADVISGKSSSISGVVVKDDQTLQVTIDSPKSYFLYKMTYPTTFLVDKNKVTAGTEWWRKSSCGSGPFILSQWTQGESLTLVRNNLFYGEKAKLSRINYQYYTGTSMDLYETGSIDVAGVSTSYIDAVMDKSGSFYNDLRISSVLSMTYIGFNCSQAPFDDVSIRQAFSLAVDKDKIISLIYRNMEKKADGILPPGMPGYNSAVKGLNYDPVKAVNLIKSSKYGDVNKLPPITLTTYGYGAGVGNLLQALVYQWKQNLGVDVKIRQLETERYFYNTQAEIDQLFMMSWSADYPHPQDFLDILFHGNTTYNYGSYSNAEADALVAQANRAQDQVKSFALYQQAEQKIVDDAACISISFGMNYMLIKPYIQGYSVNPLGFVNLQDVTSTN